MFDTPADAQVQLAQHFTRPQVETIVAALVPTLVFRPLPQGRGRPEGNPEGSLERSPGGSLGGTRIGGTPDLPPGLGWPRRAMPADMEAIARRGNAEAGEEMRRHFRGELPYAFFAQVDLAEASGQGAAAADLPGHGRLLVFYDLAAGPWDTGTGSVRVIWDESPREALAAQAVPPDLAAAARAHRAEIAAVNREFGLPAPKPDAGTPYGGPARPMSLRTTLRPPAVESLEAGASPALKAALERGSGGGSGGGDRFREAYAERFARAFDPYYGSANSGRRNQLLGSPLPEQSDPRYEAEVASRFGVQHLDPETRKARWPEVEAGARDWRLLLQIDVGDYLQEAGEGTVYLLIRARDLAERRFDRVVAVYQQT